MQIETSILNILSYFSVFNHPLNREELGSFLDAAYEAEEKTAALEFLVREKLVCRYGDYYSLHDLPACAEKRRKANQKAEMKLRIAGKMASRISAFPFVKAVLVSGSLSKRVAYADSDIDFFIITTPERLWISRTLLHGYKKLMSLLGKKHYLCMNYFVDESALSIRERNIFTAMEISTALPFRDRGGLEAFYQQNTWTRQYFPLASTDRSFLQAGLRSSFFQRLIEPLFKGSWADKVDIRLLNITSRRWKKKAELALLNDAGEPLGMDAGRHYSKPDPGNLQKKILSRYALKQEEMMARLQESQLLIS